MNNLADILENIFNASSTKLNSVTKLSSIIDNLDKYIYIQNDDLFLKKFIQPISIKPIKPILYTNYEQIGTTDWMIASVFDSSSKRRLIVVCNKLSEHKYTTYYYKYGQKLTIKNWNEQSISLILMSGMNLYPISEEAANLLIDKLQTYSGSGVSESENIEEGLFNISSSDLDSATRIESNISNISKYLSIKDDKIFFDKFLSNIVSDSSNPLQSSTDAKLGQYYITSYIITHVLTLDKVRKIEIIRKNSGGKFDRIVWDSATRLLLNEVSFSKYINHMIKLNDQKFFPIDSDIADKLVEKLKSMK